MTPLANHFRGVADRHARSGYAGGSWRTSWPIRLGAAMRFQSLYRKLANQNRFDRAHAGARHNSDDDRHAPTWRTGLAKMIVDRDVPTVNGMPVHGSVRMNVSHELRFRGAPIWEAPGSIPLVRAAFSIHGIRRRSAARASRERVTAFSFKSSCRRAASQASAETMGGVSIVRRPLSC